MLARVICGVFLAVALLTAGAAMGAQAQDFAIYAGQNATLESYSVVQGNVYSGGDLNLEFGYGIQRSSANAGDMLARGSIAVGGLSDINGSVRANGNVAFQYWVDVTGSVTYGGAFNVTGSPGTISGTVALQAGSVAPVALPRETTFVAGTNDVTSGTDLDLSPGVYGKLTMSGVYRTLSLHAGDYYISSLNMGSGYLQLHLDPGESIRVFSAGDIKFTGHLDVFVNGREVNAMDAATRALAANVLFESHGNVQAGVLFDEFFGTLFTPLGSVEAHTNDFYGSIIAGNSVTGEIYIQHVPSALVPEPATLSLLALGGLAILRRRSGQVLRRSK